MPSFVFEKSAFCGWSCSSMHVHVYAYMAPCMCVCVCVLGRHTYLSKDPRRYPEVVQEMEEVWKKPPEMRREAGSYMCNVMMLCS